jgi:hypothetical protein
MIFHGIVANQLRNEEAAWELLGGSSPSVIELSREGKFEFLVPNESLVSARGIGIVRIEHYRRLEALAEVEIDEVRFGKILERDVIAQRPLPVNAIGAFGVGRQGDAPHLHRSANTHVGVMRRMRLGQIIHLV